MPNTTLPGLGFHHIAIKCTDLDRSIRFYCDGLGCCEMYRWGEGDKTICMLDMGDGTVLELFAGGTKGEICTDESQAGKYYHLAMKVDDVKKAYDRAIAYGATSRTPPQIVNVKAQPHDIAIDGAFVYGPDCELLEFFKFA